MEILLTGSAFRQIGGQGVSRFMVGDAHAPGIEDPALPLKTGDRFRRFLEVPLGDRFSSSRTAIRAASLAMFAKSAPARPAELGRSY